MGVRRIASAGDLAGRDLQRGVEAGRAVALVVVGHPRGAPGLDRQRRLGAIQRLDLCLLVDAEHDRALRRVQIQADDIDHLLDQLRVLGELERADLMRLELVITPDPVNGRGGDPRRRRKPPRAPLRTPVRRRLQRHRQHPLHLRVVDLARTPRPRRGLQPLQPPLAEVPPPQPDRRKRHTHLRRDLRVRRALSRTQHDPRAHRLLLRRRRCLQHRTQLGLLLLGQLDRRCAPGHTTTVREVTYKYKLLKTRCPRHRARGGRRDGCDRPGHRRAFRGRAREGLNQGGGIRRRSPRQREPSAG